ncbi:MAG: biotin/lipoate A/B protein ligase family protein [Candidatus Brocadiales bacterium]|nr:biotin/lipoate A/B protein ligase family protein [Candidatus Brocadiales bacterium]
MAIDEALARAFRIPTFRIYTWKRPSLSLGYSQMVSHVLNFLGMEEGQVDIVRRPTGGQAVLHDGGPSYSLVMSEPHHLSSQAITSFYHLLGRSIRGALESVGVTARLSTGGGQGNSPLCVASILPGDVLYDGRKVAGFAARRSQGVTLLQGYLVLKEGLILDELVAAMVKALEMEVAVRFVESPFSEEEEALALRLREEKYSRREWNYKRP